MRRVSTVVIALAATACAPKLDFANEAGGVINRTGSIGSDRAYAMAEKHCSQYGKVAKISGRDVLTNTMRFDCVAKE